MPDAQPPSKRFPSPDQSPAWKTLKKAAGKIKKTSMADLFNRNPDRSGRYWIDHDGLSLDYSRHMIDDTILDHLLDLSEHQNLRQWRDKMFSGEKINISEKREVLHTALRAPGNASLEIDGKDVIPEIYGVLRQIEDFVEDIHSHGQIKDIVNIGIGGSYLGPEMVSRALRNHVSGDMRLHFISNIDGHDIQETLRGLKPETTLFTIASKTFTTQETLTNAKSAREWLCHALGRDAVKDHFVALSTNVAAAVEFGIRKENVFPFWDWVGGRFSLWSSIGLPLALYLGFSKFRALLDGAHSMDLHFKQADMSANMPVILGLLGIWYRNFLGAGSHAILPYDQRLDRLPAFLQQLDMESNGKSVNRNNEFVDYKTGPVIFGEPGTNGQHAFYQLLHQGTDIIPSDLIFPVSPDHPYKKHHDILTAHMLAQSEAFLKGRSLEEAGYNPQRYFPGSKPCSILLMSRLNPYNLGQLIALYEHKIFVQGIVWNLNSFDQWGVELGKEISGNISKYLEDEDEAEKTPPSTLKKILRRVKNQDPRE